MNRKSQRQTAVKNVVARPPSPFKKIIKKKKRRSDRTRMRVNIRQAQLDTTPVLRRKAYGTILRMARAYMAEYRDNPMITQQAAEILVHDLDMYAHNLVTEACERAKLGGKPSIAPTLSGKHILAVMNDDHFRRSREVCYVPRNR